MKSGCGYLPCLGQIKIKIKIKIKEKDNEYFCSIVTEKDKCGQRLTKGFDQLLTFQSD
jgi:hypothetical protein